MSYFFAIVLPYACGVIFVTGFAWRLLVWARSTIPFRIPVTTGQQKSLSWINPGSLESPHTKLGVCARMALEILMFRSLLRNTSANLQTGPRLIYTEERFLWLGALCFHWSLAIIVLRHLRFVMDPVPAFVLSLQSLDGFFEVGAPVFYLTDAIFFVSLAYLLLRRLTIPRVRYISLTTDYVAIGLLLGLAVSGIWMRYATTQDARAIKELALGLATFAPRVPEDIGVVFYAHLFFLSVLLAYFPHSKMMHMPGAFLSPTRNLANNSRMKRHVNPWDHPVRVRTYSEWEDEFREKMKAAGLPLEKR